MQTAEAWEQLERALAQTKEGCMVQVSPHALAQVLAERKQQQGQDDEAKDHAGTDAG